MTASRTRRSRSFRLGTDIGLNIAMTRSWAECGAQSSRSPRRQFGGQTIEAEPAGWGETELNPLELSPTHVHPLLHRLELGLIELKTVTGPQSQIHFFGFPV